jgi:AcrR family transcriptional regulator
VKILTAVQQQRRERILLSARDQLSQFGYEGLNMRELAVIADVSTSTLYNLYQSKDTLILAALEDQLEDINAVVAETNTLGLGRFLARVEAVADQIVETPKYAEAMGKMLFGADAHDPIVQLLIGSSLSFNREELAEMAGCGELRQETDRNFLARSLSSTGWSTVLMWMKGYVALHDFKQEYVRNAVTMMLPYVTQAAEVRLRQHLQLNG